MKKYQLLILAVLTGVLLSIGWFPNGKSYILFFAFVPLLMVEQEFYNNRALKSRLFFLFSFLAFFVWNVSTTWWIKNASLGGAAIAEILNPLFMTVAFQLFHTVKKRVGEKWGSVLFISGWLAFEFVHLNWEFSWPWLTLGNGFADNTSMIQWYEYTGILGGSLWILLINVMIFELVSSPNIELKTINKKAVAIILLTFIIPLVASFVIETHTKYWLNKGGVKVVVVQPNIDPYNEKFNGDFESQVKKMLALAEKQVDSTTDYLILPETALTEDLWEGHLDESVSIQTLKAFLKKYPKLKIVTGASTNKVFAHGEKLSESARKFSDVNEYYDAYNTALQLDNSGNIQIYHKSKLVMGVETMPFPWLMKPLEKVAINLGGTVGSLGTQEDRTAFTSSDPALKVAPVVCYESIYGEYIGEYIKNGASIIAVMTNDGWWGDTPGYKQHIKYAALRAIETRKWVVRSANTGTSAFISPNGEIIQPTEWWTPAAITLMVQPNSTLTFYVKYGDYIGRAAFCVAFAMLIYAWLIRFKIIRKQN